MAKCKNYFYKFKENGTYEIKANKILNVKGTYLVGQYIRILNSVLNDGVYQIKKVDVDGIVLSTDLADEIFKGTICGLAVPNSFLNVVKKITEYDATHKSTDIISESVTGYSCTKATNSEGNVATGYDIYIKDLRSYRRMFDGLQYVKEV